MKGSLLLVLMLFAVSACVPAPAVTTIQVYFLQSDRFAIGTEPYEQAVSRSVTSDADLPRATLEQLFLGPTAAEQEQGLVLVLSGTAGFSQYRLDDGIAHVTLAGVCNSGGSTYSIANLIRANLVQFEQVQAVKIYDENGETGNPDGPGDSIPFCLEP